MAPDAVENLALTTEIHLSAEQARRTADTELARLARLLAQHRLLREQLNALRTPRCPTGRVTSLHDFRSGRLGVAQSSGSSHTCGGFPERPSLRERVRALTKAEGEDPMDEREWTAHRRLIAASQQARDESQELIAHARTAIGRAQTLIRRPREFRTTRPPVPAPD